VFGAPIADGRANQNAVVASREIIARVDELNAEGKIPPTRIGIGFHSGEAVTGNVGHPSVRSTRSSAT
jgi:adenylate cyclase